MFFQFLWFLLTKLVSQYILGPNQGHEFTPIEFINELRFEVNISSNCKGMNQNVEKNDKNIM
jgi:hypothetical protein